jgi:MYXO-CTERM domain-containing protein
MYVGPFWQKTNQPRLLVTPNRLTFFVSADATPIARTIKLKNSGGGTLSPASLAVAADTPWLKASLGTNSVSVGPGSVSGLTRGTHQGTVTISIDGALNAPVTVPVTLVADDTFPAPAVVVLDAGVTEPGALDGSGGSIPAMDGAVADTSGLAPALDAGIADANGPTPAVDGAGADAPVTPSTKDGAVADASVTPSTKAPAVADAGTTADKKDDGCGCTLGARSSQPHAWALLVAALGLLVSRRRRR